MKYKKFEEIKVWQDARVFTRSIYALTSDISKFKHDYSLVDQLRRASCSIMLNIAEGFERRSLKEFASYLTIAKGSAGEVRSILYISLDTQYINEVEFGKLKDSIEKISIQLFFYRKAITR